MISRGFRTCLERHTNLSERTAKSRREIVAGLHVQFEVAALRKKNCIEGMQKLHQKSHMQNRPLWGLFLQVIIEKSTGTGQLTSKGKEL